MNVCVGNVYIFVHMRVLLSIPVHLRLCLKAGNHVPKSCHAGRSHSAEWLSPDTLMLTGAGAEATMSSSGLLWDLPAPWKRCVSFSFLLCSNSQRCRLLSSLSQALLMWYWSFKTRQVHLLKLEQGGILPVPCRFDVGVRMSEYLQHWVDQRMGKK